MNLCNRCNGDGVLKLRNGVEVCPECSGLCTSQSRTWPETVERIRRKHNGVFRADLYFGHDGDNVCRFSDYDKEIAKGESGRSMQEAVERCVETWELERSARRTAKYE